MLDFETYYLKGTPTNNGGYSVKELGNWRYCHDERFDPYLLSAYDGSSSWVGHPRDFNWNAVDGALLLAHNAAFEREICRTLAEQGKAPVLKNEWQCTANMMSALFSARSLAEGIRIAEGRTISKGLRDEMNGLHWDDAVKKGIADKLAIYAREDSVEGWNLWNKYNHLWSPMERELSELTMKQCARGIAINTELLKEYTKVLAEVIFHLEQSFPWTIKGAKPTSPRAIAEECRLVGIPAPGVKGKKGSDEEEAYLEWEKTYRKDFPWVAGACTWRSLNKLLTSLERIQERLRPDGTVDFSLLYFGAHTGRWSGGGAGLNMQNLRKEPIYLDGRAIVDMPSGLNSDEKKLWLADKYELDIRKIFVARPGKKFVICDLSQVEPRVMNWLAGNTDLLDAIKDGFAYYQAYARLCENWGGQPMSSKDFKKAIGGDAAYTLLKNKSLGLGYGMGSERFADYAGVPLAEAEIAVKNFREKNPKVAGPEGLWKKLEQGMFSSINSDYEVVLPSGRPMTFRNVRRETRLKMSKETGKMERRTVTTAGTGAKRKEFYGGFLTENVTQAASRDVFGYHMLKLEKNIGDVIFHVHDEAITEVDLDVTPREVEAVMSETPEWLPGCPLSGEAQESSHYLK